MLQQTLLIMNIIPVETYPVKSYGSFTAAIEGAKHNPLQPKAIADSEQLAGSMIVDAYWTETEFVIHFSNKRFLHIWVCMEELHWAGSIHWEVVESPPNIDENKKQRVGSEPVVLRWSNVGDCIQDYSAFTAKRRGAEFQRLMVNECGLPVFCQKQMIWWFTAIRRTDLDQPMLYVLEAE